MKKNFLLRLLAVITIVTVSFSCKKSKDEAVAPTKENLAGTYKLVSIKATLGGTGDQDVTDDYLEDCQKDDLYKLNADLSFQYVDAGSKCDVAGDYEDEWSLQGNVVSFDVWDFTIVKFDGKNLVGTETVPYQGMSIVLTGTFQKQ